MSLYAATVIQIQQITQSCRKCFNELCHNVVSLMKQAICLVAEDLKGYSAKLLLISRFL